MLALLLDEQIPPRVAQQLCAHRPDTAVPSIYEWQGGVHVGAPDRAVLAAARDAGLTLVTYDQKTIPPILREWGAAGTPHAGVVLVDRRTIASNDIGALVRAVAAFWDAHDDADWTNRVGHLSVA